MFKKTLLLLFFAAYLSACSKTPSAEIDDGSGVRPADTVVTDEKSYWDMLQDGEVAIPARPSPDEQLLADADELLSLINAYREENGLPALQMTEPLQSAALGRAQEIVMVFSHTRPNEEPFYTIDNKRVYAEIFARNGGSPDKILDAFLISASHVDILLDPAFKTAGCAVYLRDQKHYWVVVFGKSVVD